MKKFENKAGSKEHNANAHEFENAENAEKAQMLEMSRSVIAKREAYMEDLRKRKKARMMKEAKERIKLAEKIKNNLENIEQDGNSTNAERFELNQAKKALKRTDEERVR